MLRFLIEPAIWILVIACVFWIPACGENSEQSESQPESLKTDISNEDINEQEITERIQDELETAFGIWAEDGSRAIKEHPRAAQAYLNAVAAYHNLSHILGPEHAALKWKQLRAIAMLPYMDADPYYQSRKSHRIYHCEITYFGIIP